MFDLVQPLKNIALIIGTKKADDAVDGARVTEQVIEQISAFTKNENETRKIIDGPLKHFLREVYSGLFVSPKDLRPDLVEWC